MGHLAVCPGRRAAGAPEIASPAASLGITFNDEPDPLDSVAEEEPATVEPSFKPDIHTIRRRAQRLLEDLETLGPDDAKKALYAECGAWAEDVVAEAVAIKRGIEPIKAVAEITKEDHEHLQARLSERPVVISKSATERIPVNQQDTLRGHLSTEEVAQERTLDGIQKALDNRKETENEILGGSTQVFGFRSSKSLLEQMHEKIKSGNQGMISDSDLKRALILGNIEAHRVAQTAAERLQALRSIARYTGLEERMKARMEAIRRGHKAFKAKQGPAKPKDPDDLLARLREIGREGKIDD